MSKHCCESFDCPGHCTTIDPVHYWFGLTYSSYLVIPRSVLQSMPVGWQQRFVALLEEADQMAGDVGASGPYVVQKRDPVSNRFTKDPLSRYDRGRVRIELRPGPHACDLMAEHDATLAKARATVGAVYGVTPKSEAGS